MSDGNYSAGQPAVRGYQRYFPPPTRRQTVIWTVVPNGRTAQGKLKISVVAAPRLEVLKGPAEAPLGVYFPDFADWPAWLQDALWGQFGVEFVSEKTGLQVAVKPAAHPAGAKPDSQAWTAVFPDSTIVRSYSFTLTKMTIDPVPPDNVQLVEHLRGLYSNIGLEAVVNPPSTEMLMRPELLGTLVAKTGISRAATSRVQGAVVRQQAGAAPAGGMRTPGGHLPPGASAGPSSGKGARLFTRNEVLTAQKPVLPVLTKPDIGHAYKAYLGKMTASQKPVPKAGANLPKPHHYDFHEIVTVLREYPDMLRLLGLVIDLEVDDPGVTGPFKMRLVHKNLGTQGNTKYNALPWTVCTLEGERFTAVSNDETLQQGMLLLKDSSQFEPVQLDVDGGALKALQFAIHFARATALGRDNTAAANALPALRSTGIGIRMTDRVQRQQELFDKAKALEKKLFTRDAKGDIVAVNGDLKLYAENLTRGFRVDAAVYDGQTASWKWHSLCRRTLEYRYGQTVRSGDDPVAEGTITTGLTREADGAGGKSYQLMEALFRWDGWSLCVPRPGKTDEPETGSSGPDQGLHLQTSSAVVPGTLPRLRFGRKYRFRARTADIAGNSLPPDIAEESNTTEAVTYLRFEPVGTPQLVPQKQLGPQSPGESLETMVIRSNFDTPMEEACVRHLAPPKASPAMAEVHGRFDGPAGLDAQKSKDLIASHSGALPEYEPSDSVTVNYLPDPLACGVALGLLPGDGKPVENYFYGDPDAWPDLKSLRLRLVEGSEPPGALVDEIVLSLPKAEVAHIPYASVLCGEAGLKLMALWGWVEDEYAKQKKAGKIDSATLDNLYKTAKAMALIGAHWMLTPRREIVLVHAVKQPLREPAVVPVFDPAATKPEVMRRGLHDTWSFVDAVIETHGKSTVRIDLLAEWNEIVNDPESDQGWRAVPVKNHVLDAPVHLDFLGYPASTGGLAYYLPHDEDGFGGLFLGAYIDQAVVEPARKHPDGVKKNNPGALAVAEKFGLDQKWKNAGRELSVVAVPRHEFGDTKHRKVAYSACGTTRFREYFLPARNEKKRGFARETGEEIDIESRFTRTGPAVTVHVPNAARPGLLKLAYVVPTFGWEQERTMGKDRSRTRRGNGLRVYLEGPWFLSGEDEMLGVVIKPQSSRGHLVLSSTDIDPHVTQWAQDPIWKSAPLPENFPSRDRFRGDAEYLAGLSLAELEGRSGNSAAVVGYEVYYDKARGLWYADIEMDPGDAYFPFIRLALARYQPFSVRDAHLSHVQIADFIQLAPDRHATIAAETGQSGTVLRVTVSGVSYGNENPGAAGAKTSSHVPHRTGTGPASGAASATPHANAVKSTGSAGAMARKELSRKTATGSVLEAGLEKTRDGIADKDLKWEPVEGSVVPLEATLSTLTGNRQYTWSGKVALPTQAGTGGYRLVIREYEIFKRETDQGTESVRRLVYADAFIL